MTALTAAVVLVGAMAMTITQSSGPDAELTGLEQRLAQAWVTGDRAFIEGLLADDWSVTDASGQVLTRAQVLAETFASTDRRIEAMAIDDLRVRLLGETAVVTGRTRATGSYKGQSATVVIRFTDVFARRSGRWQIVASHASAVTSQP